MSDYWFYGCPFIIILSGLGTKIFEPLLIDNFSPGIYGAKTQFKVNFIYHLGNKGIAQVLKRKQALEEEIKRLNNHAN